MDIEKSPDLEDRHNHQDLEDDSPAEKLNLAMDDERVKIRDAITNLSKIATLTIADTFATEEMGVEFGPDRHELILAERNRLIQRLGELSGEWEVLSRTINEVQRCVGSLQYMVDPENN